MNDSNGPVPNDTSAGLRAGNPASDAADVDGGAFSVREVQRLPTSGARAVEAFTIDATQYLAVPQMALDVPGAPAVMTGGNSDCETLVYAWRDGAFVEFQRLPVPGGEDAEHFQIGDRHFLAVAGLRSGQGPYSLAVESVVFEWRGGRFEPLQRFPTFAAKQWRHVEVDGRHFLALAQGITAEPPPADRSASSCLFEWDGDRFTHFQDVPSAWGYNWHAFDAGGAHWLAYADHAQPSLLLRWNGAKFETAQQLEGGSGRAFLHLRHAGHDWLAFASLLGESLLYRREGDGFVVHQRICGPGAREWVWVDSAGGGRLLQVNFIRGSREAPQPAPASHWLAWRGDQLEVVGELPSTGAADACTFQVDGARYLAVAHALGNDIRFRVDSPVWRLPG